MMIETRPLSITGKILETPVLWYGEKKQVVGPLYSSLNQVYDAYVEAT